MFLIWLELYHFVYILVSPLKAWIPFANKTHT